MKHIRHLLALILAVLLACSVLPAAFAADSKVIASGGIEAITWTLTDDGVLTVSGNGPIVDDEEYEYDEDGEIISINKLDSIGWQLDAYWVALTEGRSAKEAAELRYSFVKELIIEEGITRIPDDEFLFVIYPRTIVLPSTLQSLGNSSLSAQYAESLTVNGKDTAVTGNVRIAAYHDGATPFASIDEAIEAQVNAEVESAAIQQKTEIIDDTGLAYEIKEGLYQDMTKKEFLAQFNETYGKSYTKLVQCISFGIKRINKLFGTNYASVEEIFTVEKYEDGDYSVQRDEKLDDVVMAMYDATDLTARLDYLDIGMIEVDSGKTAYRWLTVSAPSGSDAEEAAKTSGLPFHPTTPPEPAKRVTFLDKIKAFIEELKLRLQSYISLLKLQFGLLK